jgi:hypothetical protein
MKKLIYDATINNEIPEQDNFCENTIKKYQEGYNKSLEALIKFIYEHEECLLIDVQMNVKTKPNGGKKIRFSKKKQG